jgi:type I restriction enzyme R subunit
MKFNEDSRVKIPTILHCMRLGFEYVSLKKQSPNINESTNIFSDVFLSSIQKINPGLSTSEARQALDEISLVLENEDLGRTFYKKLINRSGVRLIDYENFDQNTFQVVTELTYKNGEDEFRPDITLLVNGMPLVFIEVKKPNNRDGIIAEHKRIQSRFSNKKFRNFANITQLMIFSNNMEYDESSSHPVEGAQSFVFQITIYLT